jgi:hypothetical protein
MSKYGDFMKRQEEASKRFLDRARAAAQKAKGPWWLAQIKGQDVISIFENERASSPDDGFFGLPPEPQEGWTFESAHEAVTSMLRQLASALADFSQPDDGGSLLVLLFKNNPITQLSQRILDLGRRGSHLAFLREERAALLPLFLEHVGAEWEGLKVDVFLRRLQRDLVDVSAVPANPLSKEAQELNIVNVRRLTDAFPEEVRFLRNVIGELEAVLERLSRSGKNTPPTAEDQKQSDATKSKRLLDKEHEIYEGPILAIEKDILAVVAKKELRLKILKHPGLTEDEKAEMMERLEQRFRALGTPDIYEER